MQNDNRVSATLNEQDITDIRTALQTIRGRLPFLISLSNQDRKEMAKLGDKTVGFDEKCAAYMGSNPEFLPGFINPEEVDKDRALRSQIMEFFAELGGLHEAVDDTQMVVSSEVLMADLAYYQSVREAARRGRPGAETIYKDLRQRFPGATNGPSASAKPEVSSVK